MSSHLSRKQQKSQAFKAKQKAKKRGETIPEDVPEQDLIEDVDEVVDEVVGDDVVDEPGSSTGTGVVKGKGKALPTETDGPIKEKVSAGGKGKKKAKTAWDEDEDGEQVKTKKDIKQRFILFIGNLDFKTSKETIQDHFTEAVGHKPAVRLLTTKSTPKSPAQSRGIAFLELATSAELQACLKLHHSMLANRRINVELTAGGGGKSKGRKDKIKERNERVGGQRARKAEKEAELEADGETGGNGHGGNGLDQRETGTSGQKRKRGSERHEESRTEVQDGVRVRGGRRKRVKDGIQDSSSRPSCRAPRAQNEWSNNRSRGGEWNGLGNQGRDRQRPPRSGLTGANAVSIA
ncbi:hypothetical protein BD324DRAFT_679179 [Kockovaella imperatae]|uniref:Nucleolar protein 12 n=1 Tax=Kockovaella imperatae TaxID=4999 RepID=A0A1Y1URR5_9TREE|nr:hypothetical protein BD324DRAFT_679179 [Kockovaella imperatae]ORX40126.1 hypothetical protein BD324DRAFT_679179 [Kockovaella imperatae]